MRRRWASAAGPRPTVVTAWWLWTAGAVCLGLLGWAATSSFQQDLAAYYTAGAAVSRGLDPYVNYLPDPGGPWDGLAIFRHSRFLYAPLCAHLFRPWAALPYPWAKALFTAGSCAALLLAAWLLRTDLAPPTDRARPPHRDGGRSLWPLLGVAWVPVFLTLERGQIDLVVLAILAGAWRCRRRPLAAGLLLAAAMMGKPLLLGVWPLLVAARAYRWAAAALAAVLLLAGLNVAVAGRALSLEYARQVLPRAAQYGEGGTPAMLLPESQRVPVGLNKGGARADDGLARINGRGRAFREELGTFARGASLPRLLATDDAPPALTLSLLIFAATGGVLVWAARRAPESAAWFWGGAVAAVVSAPVSWAMDLVWALPLFAAAVASPTRWHHRPARTLWALAWVAGMLGPLFQPAWILTALFAIAGVAVVATQDGTGPGTGPGTVA